MMNKESKHSYYLLEFYKKGYRIDKTGRLLNPRNIEVKGCNCCGYMVTNFRINGIPGRISFHQLQAYQKFGDKIFEEGIVVRHLNGNSLDNSWDNIEIGTQTDNMSDRTLEQVYEQADKAGLSRRIFNYDAIIKAHEEGMSYNEIIEKFGCSSKGQVSYIINRYKYIRKKKTNS